MRLPFSAPLPIKDVPRPNDGPCDPRRVPSPLHGRQGRAHHIFIRTCMLYTSAYFHLHISNKSACLHVYISSYISNISAWTTRSGTRLSPSCTLLSRSRCVVGSFQYQVLDCFPLQGGWPWSSANHSVATC